MIIGGQLNENTQHPVSWTALRYFACSSQIFYNHTIYL